MANSIDYTIGSARTNLVSAKASDIESLKDRNLLVEDYRRTRPR